MAVTEFPPNLALERLDAEVLTRMGKEREFILDKGDTTKALSGLQGTRILEWMRINLPSATTWADACAALRKRFPAREDWMMLQRIIESLPDSKAQANEPATPAQLRYAADIYSMLTRTTTSKNEEIARAIEFADPSDLAFVAKLALRVTTRGEFDRVITLFHAITGYKPSARNEQRPDEDDIENLVKNED